MEPLAYRMKPTKLEDFYGQEDIVGKDKLLYRLIKADKLTSAIFWGPPGCGKTSLARVIASTTKNKFVTLNATTAGVSDIKRVVDEAQNIFTNPTGKVILFIDEIHRFNKLQQDALLPHVEKGTVILIGATTENPYFSVNKALISRSTIFKFKELQQYDIIKILKNCIQDKENGLGNYNLDIEDKALEYIAMCSNGDVRTALNALELAVITTDMNESGKIVINRDVAMNCVQQKKAVYDKTDDSHYDIISAFIKSMRGSDPDATLHYLARMLDAGEDPMFIARRIVIQSSEDVGLANSDALKVAVAAMNGVHQIGMPEARILLAQAALTVALSPKSNTSYRGINKALEDVKTKDIGQVPMHIRNAPAKDMEKFGYSEGYKYPHDYKYGKVEQQYLPDKLLGTKYYEPREWENFYGEKKKNKNSSVFLDEVNNIDPSFEDDIAKGVEIVNKNKEELKRQRNKRINRFERNANGKMIERPKIRYQISSSTILIIFAFIILIVWLLHNYGPIFGININNNTSTSIEDNKIELVTKDSDIYGMYDNQLYVYSNNTITLYNEKSEVTWTYNFSESFSPKIYVEEKYMLVTNNSTGRIYLFENQNEILNKKIDGTIKNSFIDKYGNIAIEYSNESGYNNVISVYDKKGNSKYDTYLSQENIISLQMLENAKKIIFAEAVSESSNIGIKLRMIDITKNQDEQIKDIISLDNSFLYKFIVEGQNIYALLDDSIVSIDINSSNVNTLKEFDNTQLLFVDINNNYYTYLEREINEDRYIIENVNYDGQVISSTYVDSVPKYMISSDYVNYYIYQDYVHILNKWGVDLGNRQTNFTPKESIVFNNDKSLALIYTNKIYIINL